MSGLMPDHEGHRCLELVKSGRALLAADRRPEAIEFGRQALEILERYPDDSYAMMVRDTLVSAIARTEEILARRNLMDQE